MRHPRDAREIGVRADLVEAVRAHQRRNGRRLVVAVLDQQMAARPQVCRRAGNDLMQRLEPGRSRRECNARFRLQVLQGRIADVRKLDVQLSGDAEAPA